MFFISILAIVFLKIYEIKKLKGSNHKVELIKSQARTRDSVEN